jgi:hypothetical protein
MKHILLISPYWQEEHRWMVSLTHGRQTYGFPSMGHPFPDLSGSRQAKPAFATPFL